MKKTPKKTRMSTALPGMPPAPLPSAPPAPVQLDDGVSLLSQAFEQAGAMGSTLLAAQIGGGLSRLQQVLRRLALVESQLATALAQKLDEQAPPPSEPAPAA